MKNISEDAPEYVYVILEKFDLTYEPTFTLYKNHPDKDKRTLLLFHKTKFGDYIIEDIISKGFEMIINIIEINMEKQNLAFGNANIPLLHEFFLDVDKNICWEKGRFSIVEYDAFCLPDGERDDDLAKLYQELELYKEYKCSTTWMEKFWDEISVDYTL